VFEKFEKSHAKYAKEIAKVAKLRNAEYFFAFLAISFAYFA